MAQTPRADVMGPGILGSQHAEILREHPQVKLVALADLRPQAVGPVATSLGASSYADYREVLGAHSLDPVMASG